MKPLTVYGYTDDEGCEVEVPAKYYICDVCDGHGKHSHAVDGNGITSSEWAEWDCEEQETYMRGGYDRECEACKGTGKVIDVDWDALTPEETALVEAERKSIADSRRIQDMERAFGA